jgi:hypothetical protein
MLLLRVNASVAFLALAAGSLLTQFFAPDTIDLSQTLFKSTDPVVYATVRLVFLLLPMAITILLLRKSISGSKFLFNLVPTVLTGAVTALLAIPLLPDGLKNNIYGADAWSKLIQLQGGIIGIAVLTSMLMLWTTMKPHRDKKKKH